MKKILAMLIAVLFVGAVSQAAVRNLTVYGNGNSAIGTHANATSISFSGDKFTIHAPGGNQEYAFNNVSSIGVSENPTTGGVDVINEASLEISLADGILSINADKLVELVDVYTVEGLLVNHMVPASSQATLTVNTSAAVVIVKVTTATGVKTLKLSNR